MPTPVVRVQNLTVEQTYTQEQENHTVTQRAKIEKQYHIGHSYMVHTKVVQTSTQIHDHFCTPYIEYN